MDLIKLKSAATEAADIAKALVADPVAGKSPFAAAIRSALDHANELITLHEAWLAVNPTPVPGTSANP